MLGYMFMPFQRYADFKGRSRRMEFWSFALFNLIVYSLFFVLMFVLGFSFSAFANLENGASPSALFGGAMFVPLGLMGLYTLAIFIPNIAVTVRRFHDRDMSGWWVLGFWLLSLIPFVGWIVGIAELVIWFLPGTPGFNRFGPDPKDPMGADVFA